MKMLLVFENKFPVDKERLLKLLQHTSKFTEFNVSDISFSFPAGLLTIPKSFSFLQRKLKAKNYDKVLCFTRKQYVDNYFFHEVNNLTIFSLYGWNYLTDLPVSNGVLYFIIDYLALELDPSDFRHNDITGCIYDFLVDKRGVDDGMRQAGVCSNCLKRLSETLVDEDELKTLDDLQEMMNHLSNSSKWNKDVLLQSKTTTNKIRKRKSKKGSSVRVVIASPGDTESERKLLLDSLEVRFRRENHEDRCGCRIIVTGWEELASQPGYPQDVINEKIIDESDFVVAIFRHKLGTPTINTSTRLPRSESGTAEELLRALDKTNSDHPIGMAYFFSKAPVISLDAQDKDKIEEEWKRLTQFKETIKEKMIYKPYTDNNELITMVLYDLERNIKDFILKPRSGSS